MKIFVTGGAGFIGSNFVHYWIEKYPKDKIIVYDSLTYAGNIENLKDVAKKITFIKGDILDRDKLKTSLKGVDTVVHFAAESHVDKSVFNPAIFWETNVEGTRKLLQEASRAGVWRFHHISTDEVYGELPLNSDIKFNEETPYSPRPENPYAVSKAEADRVVTNFSKESKMHITISNCSNNFGPFMFPEKFIAISITNLIDGLQVPVHGDGQNVRDWIHTLDHASAIDAILQKGKRDEIYLLGSENDWSNRQIAEKIVNLFGKDKSWIKSVPDRHSNDRRYAIDPSKIKKEIGWEAEYTRENFDKGLKEMISWYKENEDWWRPLLARRAPIKDANKKIIAHMDLDRELGRTRIIYKNGNKKIPGKRKRLAAKVVTDKGITRLVLKKLETKSWFKKSSDDIKKLVKKMAKHPRTIGLVEDIANRPDEIDGAKLMKITEIALPKNLDEVYGAACWFEVKNKTGKKWREGYYSWGIGPKSGAKILLLIEEKNKITHLGLLKNDKFPVGSNIYDLAGGFPIGDESVFDLISRKLYSEMGIDIQGDPHFHLKDVIGLGRIMPDAGMTNNHPLLYAVVIDLKNKKQTISGLKKGEVYETKDGFVLWPVTRISELINRVDDSYFLAIVARLFLGGVNKYDFKKLV